MFIILLQNPDITHKNTFLNRIFLIRLRIFNKKNLIYMWRNSMRAHIYPPPPGIMSSYVRTVGCPRNKYPRDLIHELWNEGFRRKYQFNSVKYCKILRQLLLLTSTLLAYLSKLYRIISKRFTLLVFNGLTNLYTVYTGKITVYLYSLLYTGIPCSTLLAVCRLIWP